MKNMLGVKISVYLAAFVLSNYLVIWYGPNGLIFTALFLIPFDFVMRCVFHETLKGFTLFLFMALLVSFASLLTLQINADNYAIAKASALSFIAAQVAAGVFYQLTIKKRLFVKVNGSDLIGIAVDSVLFQLIAFGSITSHVTTSQIAMKFFGGLFWFWFIFVKLKFKVHEN